MWSHTTLFKTSLRLGVDSVTFCSASIPNAVMYHGLGSLHLVVQGFFTMQLALLGAERRPRHGGERDTV